ncbi:acyltransferase family protein [Anabaena sp. UHCC 0451]|uniref:acyltransferase family protein n=1 Tax=Anabaena sp. UHCC 0451 TaxID=2055235 RepID=UPI002B216046|nr:acyltransferase family protein [Anabaena sp. UHCC 0451]MEA5575959.1 acyltransferase family protein [Anabaena sp. UHCC 0451]
MTLENSRVASKRLLGIDIFRGIAAYGVVLIHGLGEIPRTENSLFISNSFVVLCVPFFLITSFYFTRKSISLNDTKNYLNNRSQRILIPYFLWTLIYLLARFIGSLIGNQESFNRLISDPINIIFFGAAGVQLYFLPLLFCGNLIVIPVIKMFQKIQSILLVLICFFFSIYLFYLMVTTGNDFALGEGIAFKQIIDISSFANTWLFHLIRFILVVLAWIIKCMPYIIFIIIIQDYPVQRLLSNCIDIGHKREYKWIVLFLVPLGIFAILNLNLYFLNLFVPYISFLYAIFISEIISRHSLISLIAKKMGYFSFGIYLIHALITAGFLPIVIKLYPQIMTYQLSTPMLIISSGVIFFISLTITYLISLNKTAARILLAI